MLPDELTWWLINSTNKRDASLKKIIWLFWLPLAHFRSSKKHCRVFFFLARQPEIHNCRRASKIRPGVLFILEVFTLTITLTSFCILSISVEINVFNTAPDLHMGMDLLPSHFSKGPIDEYYHVKNLSCKSYLVSD